jgi:hypothetical protein
MTIPRSERSSPDSAPIEHLYNRREDDAFTELDRLSFREILNEDSRPTFILDLDPDYAVGRTIRPVFSNRSLKQHGRLLAYITGDAKETDGSEDLGLMTTYDDFRDWAMGVSKSNDSKDIFPLTLHYRRLVWTGSTIRQRWRIISGNAIHQAHNVLGKSSPPPPSEEPQPTCHGVKIPEPTRALASAAAIPTDEILPRGVQQPHSDSVILGTRRKSGGSSVTLGTPDSSCPDWTVPHPRGAFTDHVAFARTVDWASTPLGPMSEWSMQFRELANLVMRSPHPACLLWGEELTMVYNEGYVDIVGDKHPNLMGYVLSISWWPVSFELTCYTTHRTDYKVRSVDDMSVGDQLTSWCYLGSISGAVGSSSACHARMCSNRSKLETEERPAIHDSPRLL